MPAASRRAPCRRARPAWTSRWPGSARPSATCMRWASPAGRRRSSGTTRWSPTASRPTLRPSGAGCSRPAWSGRSGGSAARGSGSSTGSWTAGRGPPRRAGPGGFRATSVKIMQDGVCENFTASMLAPYLDAHGHATAGAGASYFDPQELKAAVTAIDARGFQVHFHAIGDRAVRETLDAVEAARAANGPGRGRHHISHLQVVHPDDLPRFRALSVIANCQPLWACNEPQMTELTLRFLGRERAAWQYPFGSLSRSGAQLCFGSDWPVSSANPLWEMHTAVNRTVAPGYPYAASGGEEPFLPSERIDLAAALAAFTIGSAYVNHAELE